MRISEYFNHIIITVPEQSWDDPKSVLAALLIQYREDCKSFLTRRAHGEDALTLLRAMEDNDNWGPSEFNQWRSSITKINPMGDFARILKVFCWIFPGFGSIDSHEKLLDYAKPEPEPRIKKGNRRRATAERTKIHVGAMYKKLKDIRRFVNKENAGLSVRYSTERKFNQSLGEIESSAYSFEVKHIHYILIDLHNLLLITMNEDYKKRLLIAISNIGDYLGEEVPSNITDLLYNSIVNVNMHIPLGKGEDAPSVQDHATRILYRFADLFYPNLIDSVDLQIARILSIDKTLAHIAKNTIITLVPHFPESKLRSTLNSLLTLAIENQSVRAMNVVVELCAKLSPEKRCTACDIVAASTVNRQLGTLAASSYLIAAAKLIFVLNVETMYQQARAKICCVLHCDPQADAARAKRHCGAAIAVASQLYTVIFGSQGYGYDGDHITDALLRVLDDKQHHPDNRCASAKLLEKLNTDKFISPDHGKWLLQNILRLKLEEEREAKVFYAKFSLLAKLCESLSAEDIKHAVPRDLLPNLLRNPAASWARYGFNVILRLSRVLDKDYFPDEVCEQVLIEAKADKYQGAKNALATLTCYISSPVLLGKSLRFLVQSTYQEDNIRSALTKTTELNPSLLTLYIMSIVIDSNSRNSGLVSAMLTRYNAVNHAQIEALEQMSDASAAPAAGAVEMRVL